MHFTGKGSSLLDLWCGALDLHARLLDLHIDLLDLPVDLLDMHARLLDLRRMPRCIRTFTECYARNETRREPRSIISEVTDARNQNNTKWKDKEGDTKD